MGRKPKDMADETIQEPQTDEVVELATETVEPETVELAPEVVDREGVSELENPVPTATNGFDRSKTYYIQRDWKMMFPGTALDLAGYGDRKLNLYLEEGIIGLTDPTAKK